MYMSRYKQWWLVSKILIWLGSFSALGDSPYAFNSYHLRNSLCDFSSQRITDDSVDFPFVNYSPPVGLVELAEKWRKVEACRRPLLRVMLKAHEDSEEKVFSGIDLVRELFIYFASRIQVSQSGIVRLPSKGLWNHEPLCSNHIIYQLVLGSTTKVYTSGQIVKISNSMKDVVRLEVSMRYTTVDRNPIRFKVTKLVLVQSNFEWEAGFSLHGYQGRSAQRFDGYCWLGRYCQCQVPLITSIVGD